MSGPDSEPIPIVPPTQPAQPQPAPAPPPPPKRGRAWIIVVVVVLLLVVAVGAMLVMKRKPAGGGEEGGVVASAPKEAPGGEAPKAPEAGAPQVGPGAEKAGPGGPKAAPGAEKVGPGVPKAEAPPPTKAGPAPPPAARPIDAPTHAAGGAVLVGARAALEADGWTVHWLGGGSADCWKGAEAKLALSVGRNAATLNGKTVNLPAPAVVVDGRLLVPPKLLAEATAGRLSVDPATGKVTVGG